MSENDVAILGVFVADLAFRAGKLPQHEGDENDH
jgi:hypothetical protein